MSGDILPMHYQILTNLKEAILFVRQDGEIIKGNNAAYTLLNMEEMDYPFVYGYLDFGLLQENSETHLLMEQKNKNGRLIEVK